MPLIQLRAGRCERRGNTNWVDPQPGKGLISLENEDGLLHFQYRDLESNSLIDDLILFPGDATFTKCSSAGGGDAARVYVLKFTSSSARHFYWLQDVSSDKDERQTRRVNALIDDPDAQEDTSMQTDQSSSASPATSTAQPQASENQTDSSSSSSSQQPTQRSAQNIPAGVTPEQMAQLQAILSQSSGGNNSSSSNSMMPSVSLADILSPARLSSMLDANPSLAESLYAYLPSDTSTVPHNLETLKRVVTSPELRKSARSLDQALTTGALGPLAASLGMTEEETFGVENYLKGVQRLGDEERRKTEGGNDSMRVD